MGPGRFGGAGRNKGGLICVRLKPFVSTPRELREYILARRKEGVTYPELAKELGMNVATLWYLLWLSKHLHPRIAERLTWEEADVAVPVWSAQSIARLSLAQQSALLDKMKLCEHVPSRKELKEIVRAVKSGRNVSEAWNASVDSQSWLPVALTIILSFLIKGIFSDDDIALHGVSPKAAWKARSALLQAGLASPFQEGAYTTLVATKRLQDVLKNSVSRMGPEATERLFGRFIQLFTVGWDEKRYSKFLGAIDEAFRNPLKDMSEEERFAWLRRNASQLGFGR